MERRLRLLQSHFEGSVFRIDLGTDRRKVFMEVGYGVITHRRRGISAHILGTLHGQT